MPAARPRGGPGSGGLVEHLDASAPTRPANNALPIAAYYRGCDLLQSQVRGLGMSGVDRAVATTQRETHRGENETEEGSRAKRKTVRGAALAWRG